MVKFIINFIFDEGFFKKDAFFEKSSQIGRKMPKWVTILAFSWAFLVIYSVLNLFGQKEEQVILKTSDQYISHKLRNQS